MATLAVPLKQVAGTLRGQPVFLADGEEFGVVDHVIQIDDEASACDCLVILPADEHPSGASNALLVPEDSVLTVTDENAVVLRTTRAWVGHYCLPSPSEEILSKAERRVITVWSALRSRVARIGRR